MRSVLVVVTDVFFEETLQVPFVESNHVIEQIAATTLYPAFSNSILPRASVRHLKSADLHRAYGNRNLQTVLRVAIENQEAGSGFERKGLPQLLYDPRTCRMSRHVEMQNPSSVVTDHEEAVEYAERDGRNGEEIHHDDCAGTPTTVLLVLDFLGRDASSERWFSRRHRSRA